MICCCRASWCLPVGGWCYRSNTHLRATLQAAPLGSEEDILEVQLEVRVHAGHPGCGGRESPEGGCCSSGGCWSQTPTTKPEPPDGQRIYSRGGPVQALAPMALFGPGFLSPSIPIYSFLPPFFQCCLSLPLSPSGDRLQWTSWHACVTCTHTHTHSAAVTCALQCERAHLLSSCGITLWATHRDVPTKIAKL